MTMTNVAIIYHSDDLDGHLSGELLKRMYPQASLMGMHSGDILSDEECQKLRQNDIIFIADLSFPANVMEAMRDKLVWIDHHISSINDLSLTNIVKKVSPNKSACRLVWEYLYGEDFDPPKFLRLIEKYDLRKQEEDWSDVRAFQLAARTYQTNPAIPESIEFWDQLFKEKNTTDRLIEQGKCMDRFATQQNLVLRERCFPGSFEGLDAILYNGPNGSEIIMPFIESGEYQLGIFFQILNEKKVFISLRSQGDLDVSEIAKRHGGGGHKNAAAFTCTPSQLVKIILGG